MYGKVFNIASTLQNLSMSAWMSEGMLPGKI